MKKLKFFLVQLAFLLTLGFMVASCEMPESTKDGTIVLRNDSNFSEDNPMTARLTGGNVDQTNSVNRNNRVTWNNVPSETSYTIRVTDKNGRTTSAWLTLGINESRTLTYNGTNITTYNP